MLKIDTNWREIMRAAKAAELERTLSILSQTFEREVDRNNTIIETLVKELEEAEEQYQTALSAHLEVKTQN